MNKKYAALLCGLCCFSSAQAGTLGEAHSSLTKVFAAAEGGWTSNKLNGIQVNIINVGRIYTLKTSNKGSARLAFGAQREIRPNLSAIAEMGYGYYGKTNFRFQQDGPVLSAAGAPNFRAIQIQSTLDGLDLLTGLAYSISQLDLSVKLGAMVENARYKPSVNLSNIAPGNIFGSVYINSNLTQVFPEIKLGLGYEIVSNLAVTAAWTHVFGEKPGVNLTINPNFPPGTIDVRTQNPALDVFSLGARYSIPL